MAKSKTYQFVRIQGFPRGSRSKRGTLGSVIAEGLRAPTHISHLPGSPDIVVDHMGSPVASPEDLSDWVNRQMETAVNTHIQSGVAVSRSLRKDALAIGTVIISYPHETANFDRKEFDQFVSDSTEWVKSLLVDFQMLLHFRLTHLDEKYPHLHFWFTPQPNEQRNGNWVLASLCSEGKGFYHQLQKRFFFDVGHKYFDARAKPMEERNKRLPRHIAIHLQEQKERERSAKRDEDRQFRNEASLPTLTTISNAIEELAEQEKKSPGLLMGQSLSEKSQAFLGSLSLAPLLTVKPDQPTSRLKESLTRADKAGEGSSGNKKDGHVPPEVIALWLKELIFPVLLDVAYQQSNRAEHLGVNAWINLVAEEAAQTLEEKLSGMGLTHEGVGRAVMAMITESGFGDHIVSARQQSDSDRRVALEESQQSDGHRGQGRLNRQGGHEGQSAWDAIMPR